MKIPITYFLLLCFLLLKSTSSAGQEEKTPPAAVTCGMNYFVHAFNGTSRCMPCPPDSHINESLHNFTMCIPVPRVHDNTRFWNFLAGQMNPYVFLGCIFLTLLSIIAFACVCWRKISKTSECNITAIYVQGNGENQLSNAKSQALQEKLLPNEPYKSSILQEDPPFHKIKGLFKFLKNIVHQEEHQRFTKNFAEDV